MRLNRRPSYPMKRTFERFRAPSTAFAALALFKSALFERPSNRQSVRASARSTMTAEHSAMPRSDLSQMQVFHLNCIPQLGACHELLFRGL
jgi:hypothetical protein